MYNETPGSLLFNCYTQMKIIALLLILALVSGCTDIYGDLEKAFEAEELPVLEANVELKTFSVSSQKRKGIENFRDIATVLISTKGIVLDAGAPFTKRVFIPTNEVIGCTMTCFGTDDQHVNLLIPKTGTSLMVQSSEALLNWCWENKKPMFSSKSKRGWLYKGVPLPPVTEFEEQFNDRKVFDEQKKQSCLGY